MLLEILEGRHLVFYATLSLLCLPSLLRLPVMGAKTFVLTYTQLEIGLREQLLVLKHIHICEI